MPRDLSLGNGKLQINFGLDYSLRDIFFPRVGQENHTAGAQCRTGVWSNDRFAWIESPEWERTLEYEDNTLVTRVRLYRPEWDLELVFNDTVDLDRCIFLRRVTATNHAAEAQEVRLFFHYDFNIYGVEIGDTILYDPELKAMVAYKNRRYFLLNVSDEGGYGIRNWAIGITNDQGPEGTWRDAEDGHLQGNAIAQGSVDGTAALFLGTIQPGVSATGYHWLVAGQNRDEVNVLDQHVRERTPDNFIERTHGWWHAWIEKEGQDLVGLRPETLHLYKRSLLTIRTHVDDDGAIIAATDWDIIHFSRDTYAYCWPRDGALVALALDKAGYGEITRWFFNFCLRVLDPNNGFFLHKYTPRGDVASSWHPWLDEDGRPQLPVQEDETGLVLHALWHHYEQHRDIEFIKPLYRAILRVCADFLATYRDAATKLPLPSYDLWEERWGVHAFTTAAVWAGLDAAANFATLLNQGQYALEYRRAADEIRQASIDHFWDRDRGHFSRSLTPNPDGTYTPDSTLDASVLALSLFGMVEPDDPKMRATAEAIHERLWVQTPVGGLARYENDTYQSFSQDPETVPGNPWFITTLWLAQYYASVSTSRDDLKRTDDLLRWVEKNALPSGLLAEQLHPYTGDLLSVSPLTWSHAEYVTTVHMYLEVLKRLP